MTTTARHAPIVSPSPPSPPRLCLVEARADRAVLDGGWWPRSTDPVAEIPGLVLALGKRFGPVRQLMLNSETWDSRPRRLTVGARMLRLGWFVSVDPALAIATTEDGDQFDLLVVPVGTAEAAARTAMARAADPADTARPSEIITATAVRAAPRSAAAAPWSAAAAPVNAAGQDDDMASAWENEGGHQGEGRSSRDVDRAPAAVAGRGIRS